jgi:hypothetical protein
LREHFHEDEHFLIILMQSHVAFDHALTEALEALALEATE